jgi:glycine betaine/proline transport system permease protein
MLPGVPQGLKSYPEVLVLPVNAWTTSFVNSALRDQGLGTIGVKDVSRALGAVLEAPVIAIQRLLAKGFAISLRDDVISLPPLSWLGVMALAICIAASVSNLRLTLLTAATFLYVAAIGLWQSTMLTLALVLVAVVIGAGAGLALGIASYRSRTVHHILSPVLDFMQTVPVFGYLVPAILLFGYNPAAALVVTLIYTVPPMVHVTRSALLQTSEETIELGRMTGCSTWQLLSRVMLPSERPRLMLGVNQVIMLTLNMVIISSLIGAGGLGYDVWQAVKSLKISRGVEAGVAITLVAITLDRLSQAYASKRPDHRIVNQSLFERRGLMWLGVGLAIALTLIGQRVDAIAQVPSWLSVSSGRFWEGIVDWININAYGGISLVKDTLFVYLLRPTKELMLDLPWAGVVVLLGAMGYRLGGLRLGLLCAALTVFIAVAGQWEKAMLSVYLVAIAVAIAALIGVPLGFLAASNERLHAVSEIILDTLQTLPSFVYLIPVVMLLGVGDFSALVAIVLYAVAPAVRYTASAVRQVPPSVVEAAKAFGATPAQIRRRVILPLAFPGILLALNQTLMLGISMLIITALVGTRDLGQETLIALSKSDPGRGLVAGICVAFIAIIASRLMLAWCERRQREVSLNVR